MLKEMWGHKWFTNNGSFHKKQELDRMQMSHEESDLYLLLKIQ